MEYLQHLLDNTGNQFFAVIILGFMTAISPCPLATNITAIGYIGRDLDNKQRIFINGLVYTLGRALSYTLLGIAIYFGASKFHVAKFFQMYGERLLGPLLIVAGVFMLDIIKIRLPGFYRLTDKLSASSQKRSSVNALLLGIVFALAFCPYSGMLYFGMLIPISISSSAGLYLPVIYAFITGLPVIVIAWLLAYSISSIGNFYNRIKAFEKWFRMIVALLFIGIGLYYVFILFVAKITMA